MKHFRFPGQSSATKNCWWEDIQMAVCPHLIFRLLYVLMCHFVMHTLCKSYICLNVMGYVSMKEVLSSPLLSHFLFSWDLLEWTWCPESEARLLESYHGHEKTFQIVENRKCFHLTSREFKIVNVAIQILLDAYLCVTGFRMQPELNILANFMGDCDFGLQPKTIL